MVDLKNCESELSYALAELFNKCLKESCSPYCSKVSSVVLIFKNIGEQSTAKNFFLWLLKSLKKPYLEKCDLLSDFQYGFRSSRSTTDLLKVYLIELQGLLQVWGY